MSFASTIAGALKAGDEAVLVRILGAPLRVARNNFVERPWGGTRIREYKGLHPLPEQAAVTGLGIGEAFELAAFDEDAEAARFPSRVVFDDGSVWTLPEFLHHHGHLALGDAFVERYGRRLPLLPKTLDVRELLSVQGHPAGNTEVYIIIDAEPGATLALGFNREMDPAALRTQLKAGLALQGELVGLLAPGADLFALHNRVARWFAARDAGALPEAGLLSELLADAGDAGRAEALLGELKRHYWDVLDSLNHIEVSPGQVIYNATPSRLLGPGQRPAAEVHALGNPGGLEVVALEVRLPGPTFRAWDNVRFPQREVDVEAAIAALNLSATSPDEFICTEIPDPARPGVTTSVDCEYFRVEHLRPAAGRSCAIPAGLPRCLHVLEGDVTVQSQSGAAPVRLARGESALLPVPAGECRIDSVAGAHVVCVTLPCD